MADQKISALTELTGADVDSAADVLPIVDTSVTTTKKILVSNLLGGVFTTAGDIMQASGDGVAARLGIGTARQVPMVNAGATALAYTNPITITAEVASTSGTTIDFTSIPAGVRRITIMFVGVSTNGTSALQVQIGDSGGIENSGYSGGAGNRSTEAVNSAAFNITQGMVAANAMSGHVVLSLQNVSTFTWTESGTVVNTTDGISQNSGGSKSLSAALDRVRVTTASGDTFDAGAISISYE